MARYWDGISVSDEGLSVFCCCVLGLKPSSFPPRLSAGWGCSVWTWDKRLDRRGSTLRVPFELKRFCSRGVCGGANQTLWRVSFYPPSPLACSRSPSLLHFLLLLLTHPSLPLSEWVALGLLGLVEVYQKHVCRVGGGRWEVLRPAHPPPPSWWGRKALSEFWDVNLLDFYRIFLSAECINRKKLLTLNCSV